VAKLDLNNLGPGTTLTRDLQDGRGSVGIRTHFGEAKIATIHAMAVLANPTSTLVFPGTSLPLKRISVTKMDRGNALITEEYRLSGNQSGGTSSITRVRVRPGRDFVQWFTGQTGTPQDDTWPTGVTESADTIGKFQKPIMFWRIEVPFNLQTSPLNSTVRLMVNKCNSGNFVLGGTTWKKAQLVFGAPWVDVIESTDGTDRYIGSYTYFATEEIKGWRDMRKGSDKNYYLFNKHLLTKFTVPPL